MRTNITFDDVPSVLVQMQTELSEVKTMLKQALSGGLTKDEKKLFGLFDKNEMIYLKDPRLWSLPTSPFRSRRALYNAKYAGHCPFKRPAGEKLYVIKAQDLADWFTEWSAYTKIPKI